MEENWRSRPRRKVRSAPIQRPVISVTDAFGQRIEALVGPRLASHVLKQFGKRTLPGTPAEFHALEAALLKVAQEELVASVLFEVVHEVHAQEEFVVWSMAQARRKTADLRATTDRPITIRVTGGELRLESPYMAPSRPSSKKGPKRLAGRRGKGGGGLFPVLAALGFVKRVSPFVASEVAQSAALLCSFEEASYSLASRGIEIDPDTARNVANEVGDAGLVDRENDEPVDDDLGAERVVICMDGGRLRCRETKPGVRLPSGFHGYHTPWLEPKMVAAYAVGDTGEKIPGSRPVYETTLAPWKDAIPVFARTLRRHGIQRAKSVLIAADGSDHIWREVERLIELAGLEPSRVVKCLDFYHAMEHVNEAAQLTTRFTADSAREAWVTLQAHRLKAGEADLMIRDLQSLPTTDLNAPELVKQENYFVERLDLLRYDQISAMGFPMGTGAVESAIRRIVNLRLKAPSTFWCPENAERMLYLRCRAKANRWSEVDHALHRRALVPARTQAPEVLELVG